MLRYPETNPYRLNWNHIVFTFWYHHWLEPRFIFFLDFNFYDLFTKNCIFFSWKITPRHFRRWGGLRAHTRKKKNFATGGGGGGVALVPTQEKNNFSRKALFHMKTRVCLKYFVSDWRLILLRSTLTIPILSLENVVLLESSLKNTIF